MDSTASRALSFTSMILTLACGKVAPTTLDSGLEILQVDAGSPSVGAMNDPCANIGECECSQVIGGSALSPCSVGSISPQGIVGVCCAEPQFISAGTGTCDCISFSCTSAQFCTCAAGIGQGTLVDACTPSDAGGEGACCFVPSKNTCSCDSDVDSCKAQKGKVVPQCDVSLLDQTCATNYPGGTITLNDCRAGN